VNDDQIDLTATDTDVATAPVTKRRPVRWFHIAILGMAVLVAAAAVGFFTSQSSDRDDATAKREDAQSALAAQRDSTDHAKTTLASERTAMQATTADVQTITTSLHEFSDLVAQHVDAAANAHAIALRLPDSVDEFNAAVDHANAVLIQVEAKAEAIQQQIDALRDETKGQFAAATSSR
jgi:hypothetical protein